jgi:hypothetical protein
MTLEQGKGGVGLRQKRKIAALEFAEKWRQRRRDAEAIGWSPRANFEILLPLNLR